eukprot:2025336-Alexandrium_andersonii.AAC.1
MADMDIDGVTWYLRSARLEKIADPKKVKLVFVMNEEKVRSAMLQLLRAHGGQVKHGKAKQGQLETRLQTLLDGIGD